MGRPVSGGGPLLARRLLATLDVLQALANLTLGEIGQRLFVSRNTAKSHAAAIYRKLGVSSRGEAVEAARLTGLLSE